MIISASRRTDLPAFYADWFWQRLQAGYALVPNPMNPRQVKRVSLHPRDVDGFVFWTKNPSSMLQNLKNNPNLDFYFQYTLNGYGADVEPGLPALSDRLDIARSLGEFFGPERLVIRLDPVLHSLRYPMDFHFEHFHTLARTLKGCFDQCTFSFLDLYTHIRQRLVPLNLLPMDEAWRQQLAAGLAEIAEGFGLRLCTCAETADYGMLGIEHGRCIDPERLGRILGHPLRAAKDRGQRPACGCAASQDIGMYHCCGHFCRYCYANVSEGVVRRNMAAHRTEGELLLPSQTAANR